MSNYIDPVSYLSQNLGEIYSDKSLRLVGYAKVNLSNPNLIDTFGLKLICSPTGGGSEAITNIRDGAYLLLGEGSSLWVRILRNGTDTLDPVIYAAGAAPRPSRDYIQVFYRHSIGMMGFGNQYIAQSVTWTNIGAGIGQKTFDAIVSNDSTGNYTSLWAAISDLAAVPGARILVRNDQTISTATTISNSYLYIEFGEGVKITSSVVSGTALTFSGTGTSTNNLTLLVNGTGVGIGVVFSGTRQHHTNMTVDISGICPVVFNFGASSRNNYLEGKIILSGGSFTTDITNSATLSNNEWCVTTNSGVATSGKTFSGANTFTDTSTGTKIAKFTSDTAAASATDVGIVTIGPQTIAGAKTFTGTVQGATLTSTGNINALSGTITGNIVIGAVYQ